MNNSYTTISSSHFHSTQTRIPTSLDLSIRPRVYHGYINGFRQPVGKAIIQVIAFDALQMQTLSKALNEYLSGYAAKFNSIQSAQDLVACLGEGVTALQRAAALPIFEPVQVSMIADNLFNLWIPVLHEKCFHHAMAFMLRFFFHHLATPEFTYNQALADEINALIGFLNEDAPQDLNLQFLNEAHRAETPWMCLANNLFQYGYGSQSHWFDSTFTDSTSFLGARSAKNKHLTISILQKAGIPVPEQLIVHNENEALEAARSIGFPVVIKPNNQDAGTGVHAWIMSEDQVKKSYENAAQYSEAVLLEKHIPGKDYRLLVLNGKLAWAIERIPAGVTGDGISSINELIQKTNQIRAQEKSGLVQINVTDVTRDFLAEQGYDLSSTPNLGKYVYLTRYANISTGGTPVAVFDKVHPDNAHLAVTVANLFRLDIAGIDLITPDIQQSCLTNGGAIIEVNSQPQLGSITAAHMYKQILNTKLPNQGRIPIIVVCSNSSENLFVQQLQSLLSSQYQNIAAVKDKPSSVLFDAGLSALLNPQIDALIYCINSLGDIEFQGLPFDRYDCLFFLEAPLANSNITKKDECMLINTLFTSCSGHQLVNENLLGYLTELNATHQPSIIFNKHNILSDIKNNLFNWLSKSGCETNNLTHAFFVSA